MLYCLGYRANVFAVSVMDWVNVSVFLLRVGALLTTVTVHFHSVVDQNVFVTF